MAGSESVQHAFEAVREPFHARGAGESEVRGDGMGSHHAGGVRAGIQDCEDFYRGSQMHGAATVGDLPPLYETHRPPEVLMDGLRDEKGRSSDVSQDRRAAADYYVSR